VRWPQWNPALTLRPGEGGGTVRAQLKLGKATWPHKPPHPLFTNTVHKSRGGWEKRTIAEAPHRSTPFPVGFDYRIN
jgi:hypothetical protein